MPQMLLSSLAAKERIPMKNLFWQGPMWLNFALAMRNVYAVFFFRKVPFAMSTHVPSLRNFSCLTVTRLSVNAATSASYRWRCL